MGKETNVAGLVAKILEGSDPRDVIKEAASEMPVEEGGATIVKKVVRDGKVVKKRVKKYKKHRILTPAQKKALKKAQLAAKKPSANIQRKKSLRKAKTFEDVEGTVDPTNTIICPLCGSTEVVTDNDDGQTICYCPDCDKEFILVDAEIFKPFIDNEDGDEDPDDADGVDMDIPDEFEDVPDDDAATDPATEGVEGSEGEPYYEEDSKEPLFTEE